MIKEMTDRLRPDAGCVCRIGEEHCGGGVRLLVGQASACLHLTFVRLASPALRWNLLEHSDLNVGIRCWSGAQHRVSFGLNSCSALGFLKVKRRQAVLRLASG
jgi:hypothetical protein